MSTRQTPKATDAIHIAAKVPSRCRSSNSRAQAVGAAEPRRGLNVRARMGPARAAARRSRGSRLATLVAGLARRAAGRAQPPQPRYILTQRRPVANARRQRPRASSLASRPPSATRSCLLSLSFSLLPSPFLSLSLLLLLSACPLPPRQRELRPSRGSWTQLAAPRTTGRRLG